MVCGLISLGSGRDCCEEGHEPLDFIKWR